MTGDVDGGGAVGPERCERDAAVDRERDRDVDAPLHLEHPRLVHGSAGRVAPHGVVPHERSDDEETAHVAQQVGVDIEVAAPVHLDREGQAAVFGEQAGVLDRHTVAEDERVELAEQEEQGEKSQQWQRRKFPLTPPRSPC